LYAGAENFPAVRKNFPVMKIKIPCCGKNRLEVPAIFRRRGLMEKNCQ
jgi:hypothetical protein